MTPPPTAPRTPWGRLAALTLAVLAAHLLLLGGGLPRWPLPGLRGDAPQAPGPARDGEAGPSGARADADAPPAEAAPVDRSRVRWIVLAPPPPPPPPAPPPPRPAPPPPAPPAPPPALEATPDTEPEAAPAAPSVDLPPAEPEVAGTAETEPEAPAAPVAEAADVPAPPASDEAAEAGPVPTMAEPAPAEAVAELPPAELPAAIDLRYTVSGQAKGFQYHASGTIRLRHDHQRYEAEGSVSAFLLGSRQQRSEGRIDAAGLHPETFVDRTRRERQVTLDGQARRIRFQHGGEAPLQAGTQDRLTVALQLGALFEARPDAWPSGSRIRLPVVDATDVELWDFVVEGPDTLSLDGRDVPTIRVARLPRRERDRLVQVWLAPALHHLPARIRISEANGDYVDQLIDGLPPAGP